MSTGGRIDGLIVVSTLLGASLNKFGAVLRKLRTKTGIGIKGLAPQLGVTYTYLSKLENGEVGPSEGFVDRVAQYFKYDRDNLLLSAGKVPPEVLKILQENPDKAVKFLRDRFGSTKLKSTPIAKSSSK